MTECDPQDLQLSHQPRLLYQELARRSPELARIYLGALMVFSSANPDRLALAAHGFRELIEKVPRRLGGVQTGHESMTEQARKLQESWRQTCGTSKCHQDSWKGEIDEPLRNLLTTLGRFVDWLDQSRLPRMERYARTLQMLDDSPIYLPGSLRDKPIEEWQALDGHFTTISHHNNKLPITEEEFLSQVDALERFLLSRLRPQTSADFDRIDVLVSMMKIPTSEQSLGKALELLQTPANYAYFFDNLTSPAWLGPLRDKGFFSRPPEDAQVWPESGYLARVATLVPVEVAEVIVRIPPTDNARVHDDLIDAACAMPPEVAAAWVETEAHWIETQETLHLLTPPRLGTLMDHMAKGGRVDVALRLAEAVLGFSSAPRGRHPYFRPEPKTRVDDWHYAMIMTEYLPILVGAAGMATLGMLVRLLNRAIQLTRFPSEKGAEDNSHIWRKAIGHVSELDRHGLNNLLVTALRDAAVRLVESEAVDIRKVVELFEAEEYPVFHRVALYLLRRFPHKVPDLAAKSLTNRGAFDSFGLRNEYGILLRERFLTLDSEEQRMILGWIEEGPRTTGGAADEPGTSDQLRVRLWQRDHLVMFGDSLPPEWKDRLEELIREVGPFDAEESGIWVGPTSPRTADDLRLMSTEDLLAFLGAWTPSGDLRAPSREGLGRNLARLVESEPERFAAAAEGFCDIHPTYARSLIAGLSVPASHNRCFDWKPVLALCRWILAQPTGIPEGQGMDEDQDLDYAPTRSAIVGLLSCGFSQDQLPWELREETWRLLLTLTEDPDPDPAREASRADQGAGIPELSVSSIRGLAMHAVVGYACWVRRQLDSRAGPASKLNGFGRMPEVQEVLDRHLVLAHDLSLAVRSVYGWHFSQLLGLDRGWAVRNVGTVFPLDSALERFFNAAWEGFVRFCPQWVATYDLMAEQYERALAGPSLSSDQSGRVNESQRHLAEHLAGLYAQGKIDVGVGGGLLEQFYARASCELRNHLLDHIGQCLRAESSVPGEILRRMQALWEHRIGVLPTSTPLGSGDVELSAFGQWYASGKFDLAWSIAQLKKVLSMTGRVEPSLSVVEQLAKEAATAPLDAVQCLDMMITGDKDGWGILSWGEDAEGILKCALASSNDAACQAARDVINRLLKRGHGSFRALL